MQPSTVTLSLIVGLALGFAAAFGGFWQLVIVAVFAALGLVVGKVLDGEIDLTPYLGGRRRQ